MNLFLIQPSHRRFVKILRDSYNNGTPIILNEADIHDFKELLQMDTMKAVERHKRIYIIVLRAKNRPYSELSVPGHFMVIDKEKINFIEKRFFIAEWKHLRTTIQSSFFIPFLRWLLYKRRN